MSVHWRKRGPIHKQLSGIADDMSQQWEGKIKLWQTADEYDLWVLERAMVVKTCCEILRQHVNMSTLEDRNGAWNNQRPRRWWKPLVKNMVGMIDNIEQQREKL